MTTEQMVKELEGLAQKSGIQVRFEKGDFEGGFCVLKSERIIVVNRRIPAARKATVLALGMAEIGVDEMYLKPAVREFIEDELAKTRKPSS